MTPKNLGTILKDIRINKLGLTQKEFGLKINVAAQTISHWESSRNQPSLEQLSHIADVCNIPICDLIGKPISYKSFPPCMPCSEISSNPDFFVLTEREKYLIEKLRVMAKEKRKAIETIIGLENEPHQ